MEDSDKIFSGRLKAARELRGISQIELARMTGFQPSALSNFETGTRKPSFDNLKRLAEALRVTTDYLLGRIESPEFSNQGADNIFRDAQKLTERDRDLASDFIQMLLKKRKEG
jgi:transcriptional regulator with XRE-family HTH domain